MPQCAVSFCKAKKRPFHSFPKNDQQLFDIWKGCVSNSRFSILTDEEISKQYIVCDDHFVRSCKIPGTNNLKKCSIPTENVSGFKNNSNLNIAYNLYIEKQENDPINRSVKNVTFDHNTCIESEDLSTFVNLNTEPRSNHITKIWVDQNAVIQDSSTLDTYDPLSKNINIDHDGQNQENEINPIQNISDPINIEKNIEDPDENSVLKNYSVKSKTIICAANNCFNNSLDHKQIHFFPFPADETLARLWASNAERHDLLAQPKFADKKHSYYLCAKHFEKTLFKKGSKTEHRTDITVIPTVFNMIDCLSKPGDLYCNIFMQSNEPDYRNKNKSDDGNKKHASLLNPLETYVNDLDTSKITFDDTVDKSSISYDDYGEINYSYTLYEDFVSNPGVLNLKPQPTDLLFKKDYCRLCAKLCSVATLISIFDKSGNFTMYGKMLDMCLPGKVHADDKLPHWMCSKCEYKLDVCWSTIEAFIEADKRLRESFGIHSKERESNEIFNNDNDIIFVNEGSSNLKPLNNDSQVKINIENPPNMPPEINKLIEENNKYQCLNCDQVYNTKKELVDHSLAAHNLERSKSNIVCKVVSGDAKSIATTTKLKCSKLRYECVICSSLHEKKDSLIKHSLRYHSQSGSNGKIICRVVRINNLRNNHLTCLHCKEEFKNINTYRKHMKQHFKLNCEQCGKQFSRMYKLLAHVKLHDIKSVGCAKCPQIFKDKFELLKHQVAHKSIDDVELVKDKKKNNERSLCNICGKLLSSSTLLKYHLERHAGVRSHKCSICSKAFETLLSLKRHTSTHSTEKTCICQVCGKQFGYLSVLKSHMFSHSTHRPHVCKICGAGFPRRNTLNKHLTTHEKIKDNVYECKICQLEFNSRMVYVRHKQEHSKSKKSFTCDICSKAFLTKFQMKIHRRIHTGETPYDCEQCGKSFRSLALLKQHRLIHMNVFPHQCNYCDRKFRRLQSLVVHRRTHTGEKPYPCPICGRSFANRGDMNKHKRNLHIRKNKQQCNTSPGRQLETYGMENADQMYMNE